MKQPCLFAFLKLLKLQKKIEISKPRLSRDFQRLVHRKRLVQFFVIHQFLSVHKKTVFQQDIKDILWAYSLAPFLENKKNYQTILTGKQNLIIEKILFTVFKKPFIKEILIIKFSNFFSRRNKYWILSNLFIEKKFFLNCSEKTVLKKTIKNFINLHFIMEVVGKRELQKQNSHMLASLKYHCFEYNGFLILPLIKKLKKKNLQNYAHRHGLHLKLVKIENLYNGFYILGWFFIKKSKNCSCLSLKDSRSIKNQKKQIKKYLRKYHQMPVDQLIFGLNRKFIQSPKIVRDYLFWKIWYWIKKRHSQKNSKWLYDQYWSQSTSHQWIFSTSTETLRFS